jgi:CRP-like cAMP-binding protein
MEGPSPAQYHRLGDVPIFAHVAPELLDELAASCRMRRLPQGQVLCNEGDPGDSLIVLEDGQVRVSRFTPGGREVVLAVTDAPAALGELSLLDGAPRDATITAQRSVAVRMVPRALFQELLAREPGFLQGLLTSLAQLVREGNKRHEDVVGLDVTGRLAKWLLGRATADGVRQAGVLVVSLGRSQGELAAELSMTRTSLNKTLTRLETLGLIEVDREQVLLLRPEGLLDFLY